MSSSRREWLIDIAAKAITVCLGIISVVLVVTQ